MVVSDGMQFSMERFFSLVQNAHSFLKYFYIRSHLEVGGDDIDSESMFFAPVDVAYKNVCFLWRIASILLISSSLVFFTEFKVY